MNLRPSPLFARLTLAAAVLTLLSGCTASQALRPLTVTDVAVDVGVGSPIPLEIVASGDWPDPCAQLAQVTSEIQGTDIRITLLATPANPSCPPDNVGVPFRIAVPLNPVELPNGTYSVVVNSTTESFVWPSQ
jgi:hypothetical protein